EYGLQIEGRTTNDFQHVGGSGLLLQGFPQLIQQPRVLDCDDGLGSEVLNQLDLLIGERAYLLAENVEGTDYFVIPENWDNENRARTSKIAKRDKPRIAFDIGLFRSTIGNMH